MNYNVILSFIIGGGLSALVTYLLNTHLYAPPQNFVSLIACIPFGLIALFFYAKKNNMINGYLASYSYVSFIQFLTAYLMFVLFNLNPKINLKLLTFICLLFWGIISYLMIKIFKSN